MVSWAKVNFRLAVEAALPMEEVGEVPWAEAKAAVQVAKAAMGQKAVPVEDTGLEEVTVPAEASPCQWKTLPIVSRRGIPVRYLAVLNSMFSLQGLRLI